MTLKPALRDAIPADEQERVIQALNELSEIHIARPSWRVNQLMGVLCEKPEPVEDED